MTTIEDPTTEMMNGSSRTISAAPSPWWTVRPGLAAVLAGSLALAVIAFRTSGLALSGGGFKTRSLATFLQTLGLTPALIAFATVACAIMLRRRSSRNLRTLAAVLGVLALAGAFLNSTRDSHGRGPVETMVENALPEEAGQLASQ